MKRNKEAIDKEVIILLTVSKDYAIILVQCMGEYIEVNMKHIIDTV